MLLCLLAGSLPVSTPLAVLNGSSVKVNGASATLANHTIGTSAASTVTIPPGTYLIEAPYRVTSNTTVHAEGANFVLDPAKMRSGAGALWGQDFADPHNYNYLQDYRTAVNLAGTSNVKWFGGDFNGSGDQSTIALPHAFTIFGGARPFPVNANPSYTKNVLVQGASFHNVRNYAIAFNDIAGLTVKSCQFHTARTLPGTDYATSQGAFVLANHFDGVRITDCNFNGSLTPTPAPFYAFGLIYLGAGSMYTDDSEYRVEANRLCFGEVGVTRTFHTGASSSFVFNYDPSFNSKYGTAWVDGSGPAVTKLELGMMGLTDANLTYQIQEVAPSSTGVVNRTTAFTSTPGDAATGGKFCRRFTGLKPNTTYAYNSFYDSGWSKNAYVARNNLFNCQYGLFGNGVKGLVAEDNVAKYCQDTAIDAEFCDTVTFSRNYVSGYQTPVGSTEASSLVAPTQYIDGTPDHCLNSGVSFWNYVNNGVIRDNSLPGACISVGAPLGFPMMNVQVTGNFASGLACQSQLVRWFDNVSVPAGSNSWGSFSDPNSNQNQSTVKYGLFGAGEWSHTGVDSFYALSNPVQPTAKIGCVVQ